MSQVMKSSTLSAGCAPTRHSARPGKQVPARAHRGRPVRAAKADVDMEISGLRAGLSEETKDRILNGKLNPQEKMKLAKCGTTSWTEIYELADLLRKGETKWEDINVDDLDHRAKWNGIFHRRKKTPGQCMMRFRVPGQVLTSEQMRVFGECIEGYPEAGDEVPSTGACGDITTRANIQLRGMAFDEAVEIMDKMMAVGITSKQSGMDNVRNITGSPIAGVDPHELMDPTQLCLDLQNMITGDGKGNMELANLPRKLNIAISPTRDDFPHCHINDLAFQAIENADGDVVFNVWLGGLFSAQRNEVSVFGEMSITEEQMVPFTKALLELFRDNGKREVRGKTRLMYLIDEWGVEKLKDEIEKKMGDTIAPAVPESFDDHWERRDVLGVHKQKQEGFSWVGLSVPVGRLTATDFKDLAAISEKYGNSTLRVTVDENVIIPFVKDEDVDAMLAEPVCQKFTPNPGPLERGLVSCTGSQFCGFGLAETKMRAVRLCRILEAELDIPQPVRIHWTGCPNSCGQAQVGDIGLMGAAAKLDGKAVEGVKVFLGGTIGEEAKLAALVDKTAVPAADEHLVPHLKTILVEKFGATPK